MDAKICELEAKIEELTSILEHERRIHLKIATQADRMHLQLQAIREAALDELCGITAVGPENLTGIEERE
jgi:hypothetical protein